MSFAWLALTGCSDDGPEPPQDTETSTGTATDTMPGSSGTTGESDASTTASAEDTTSGSSTSGPADSSDTGTTGEPPPSMTCEDVDQCVLVDNCCECAAYHVDDEVPECPMECIQPMCAALGIPDIGVVCEAGTCELEPRDCSGLVACDSLPPDCVEGTLPEVGPGGGGCWTGACVPIEACDPLPACEFCDETEACVATQTQQGTTYSCRAIPEDCMGVPTCECMPPETCEMPFDTCIDMDGQITCECPVC